MSKRFKHNPEGMRKKTQVIHSNIESLLLLTSDSFEIPSLIAEIPQVITNNMVKKPRTWQQYASASKL